MTMSRCAPELRGIAWLGTSHPLALAGLCGKLVLLDFWTYCCINCLHIRDSKTSTVIARLT